MPGVDAVRRFDDLVTALGDEPGVTLPSAAGGRGFGAQTLRVGGSVFAMCVQDRLVLKLPRQRVGELVADGDCEPFDNGRGRPMREWAAVVDPALDVPLGREALTFVRASRGSAPSGGVVASEAGEPSQ